MLPMQSSNSTYKLILIFSIAIFLSYLFYSPKVAVQYFLNRNNRAFFVSDLNLFSSIYFYISCFFAYLLYVPALRLIVFIFLNKYLIKDSVFFFRQICIGFIYTHYAVFFINHFDFCSRSRDQRITSITSNSKRIDLNYVLIQYSGSYWDCFVTWYCFNILILIFREKLTFASYINYSLIPFIGQYKIHFQFCNINSFWSCFYSTILFRLNIYILLRYFFCGDGLYADVFVGIISFISTEFILFSIRIMFNIKASSFSANKSLIIRFNETYFSYMFKAIMKHFILFKNNYRFLMFKF